MRELAAWPNDPAAEAAQSPQVGAAPASDRDQLIAQYNRSRDELAEQTRRRFEAERRISYYEAEVDTAQRLSVSMVAALNEFRYADAKGIARSIFEHVGFIGGRAQPAAGPSGIAPVASADPELAALLREAREYVDTRIPHWRGFLNRIDSALSRLAGPAATAEER